MYQLFATPKLKEIPTKIERKKRPHSDKKPRRFYCGRKTKLFDKKIRYAIIKMKESPPLLFVLKEEKP